MGSIQRPIVARPRDDPDYLHSYEQVTCSIQFELTSPPSRGHKCQLPAKLGGSSTEREALVDVTSNRNVKPYLAKNQYCTVHSLEHL